MNIQQEQAIIKNVIKGDTAAYSGLVSKYQHLAVTLAYNILLNKEDAEDATQEAFVKAYSSLRSFKGDARFATWFYRIVVNTALNKRKTKKLTLVEVTDEFEEEEIDMGAITRYQQKDQAKYIRQALLLLTEAERICMTMFYLNELSVEEISQLTGYSLSNIKVLLYRGRKHLYAELSAMLKHELTDLIK